MNVSGVLLYGIYQTLCINSWLTFGLFPALGYYEESHYEHVYTLLFVYMLSLFLGKYLGVDWMGHMLGVHVNFRNLQKQFSNMCDFTFLSAVYESPNTVPPHSHQHLIWSVFFSLCMFIMVLICIFLLTNDVEICHVYICHPYIFSGGNVC